MSTPAVTLHWPGKAPQKLGNSAGLPALGPARGSTHVVQGDNLQVLAALQERWQGRFTLAYLDPPFLTGKQHLRVTRRKDGQGKILRQLRPAFDDRWSSLSQYLDALHARILHVHSLLAPHGCMVLHVDPKTSHYAKILCDEVFGNDCFASEIIWRYRRWPAKTANFQRVHDVLLRYVKDPAVTPCFTQMYEPLAPSTLATWGVKKQRAVLDGEGRRARSSRTQEATPGAPMGDVWEIGIVAPVAHERTGYPTQKPEALLERLVSSCTQKGDWILDPYLGSGTTLAVSGRLGRRAVGIDNSPEALAVTRQRLDALGHPCALHVLAASGAGRSSARRAS